MCMPRRTVWLTVSLVPWGMMVSFSLPELAACRRAAGMSQVELARRVVLRPETLCRLEKQRQTASLEVILAIVRVLACPARAAHGRHRPGSGPSQAAAAASPCVPVRPCKGCGLVKPLSEFVPIKRTRNGYYGRCRTCRADRERERYQPIQSCAKRRRPVCVDTSRQPGCRPLSNCRRPNRNRHMGSWDANGTGTDPAIG